MNFSAKARGSVLVGKLTHGCRTTWPPRVRWMSLFLRIGVEVGSTIKLRENWWGDEAEKLSAALCVNWGEGECVVGSASFVFPLLL